MINLHIHSLFSDGTLSPEGVALAAAQAGLTGFSLTDHDTTAGVPQAREAARRLGLRFISGVEIDCAANGQVAFGEPEILAYGVDEQHPTLVALLQRVQAGRRARTAHFLDQLRARFPTAGLNLGELYRLPGQVVLKPMIARYLVTRGIASEMASAFDLLSTCQDLPYRKPDPAEAIATAHAAGGVAVLAHPWFLFRDDWPSLERFVVRQLHPAGLDGLETWYPYAWGTRRWPEPLPKSADATLIAQLSALAKRHNLHRTAGRDEHGTTLAGWNQPWPTWPHRL